MIRRLAIVAIIICCYVSVRTLIFYYFLGGMMSKRHSDLDWWFSWFMAIPITMVGCIAIGVTVGFVLRKF